MKVLFVVPAYNEAASLPSVIGDLRMYYSEADIVIVNDGSVDDTAAVALYLGVHLLDLPFNLGIGGAVQAGLLFAERYGYDIAVQFDGDGQHCANQASLLLDPLIKGEADTVIGSRFLGSMGYNVPLGRRLGISILRSVSSLVVGQTITDPTSGFRAYNRIALTYLAHEYPHDYPEPETVVSLCRRGFRLCEVPVQMRQRQGGRSSITPFRSLYYMAKVLLAISVGATKMTAKEVR